MSIPSIPARTRGSLLAGLIGDAGAAGSPEAQPLLFPLAADISIDGCLMLATCEALVRDGGHVDPGRIAAVLGEWYASRRLPDGGSPSLRPLRDLVAGAHWTVSGLGKDHAATTGAMLRAAPLAFFIDPSSQPGLAVLRDVVRITHQDDEALAAAVALVLAVRWCRGAETVPPTLPAEIARRMPDSAVQATLVRPTEPSTPGSNANPTVADALAAGIWSAVRHPGDLEGGIRAAASVDPAAAAAAGLVLGAAGADVPLSLVAALPRRGEIESILEPFVQLVDTVAA